MKMLLLFSGLLASLVLLSGRCTTSEKKKQPDYAELDENLRVMYRKMPEVALKPSSGDPNSTVKAAEKEKLEDALNRLNKQIGKTDGPGSETAKQRLQNLVDQEKQAEKSKLPVIKKERGQMPAAVWKDIQFTGENGDVQVRISRALLMNGQGGQFAFTLAAFDLKSRAFLVESPPFRLNVDFPKADATAPFLLAIKSDALRNFSGEASFSVVSYFSPNRQDGWKLTGFLPLGTARLENGQAHNARQYRLSLLSGNAFRYDNIGMGAGESVTISFAYDSQNDCLRFNERVIAAGHGINVTSESMGCARFQGDRMIFQSVRSCNQSGCFGSDQSRTFAVSISPDELIRMNEPMVGKRVYKKVR